MTELFPKENTNLVSKKKGIGRPCFKTRAKRKIMQSDIFKGPTKQIYTLFYCIDILKVSILKPCCVL